MAEPLFHLALADDWASAFATGQYRTSTLGASLDDVGFIHLSYVDQVTGVADAFYRGRSDVMLLAIDPERLDGEVRDELDPASGQWFPHLYGPLPVVAVIAASPVDLLDDGRLDLTPFIGP